MRYFLDTEFIERPCTIDLISVGIVREDGEEFYAENVDVDWSKASPWVMENVYPHTATQQPDGPLGDIARLYLLPCDEIGSLVREWIGSDVPEFWGYYADYDWVVFAWLFGSMIDLPNGWPMYCRDLRQLADSMNITDLPQPEKDEHNALADARWNRQTYDWLREDYLRSFGGGRD